MLRRTSSPPAIISNLPIPTKDIKDTPRNVIFKLPEGIELKPEMDIKHAFSMPYIYPKTTLEEQSKFIADGLIALKKSIPSDSIVTIVVGAGHKDYFCKMDYHKDKKEIEKIIKSISSKINEENYKKPQELQNIIEAEMDLYYSQKVREKIIAFEAYLKTLDPKTLPKYKFTTFKEDIKQFDGKDEQHPNFKKKYETRHNDYKENPRVIDTYCDSIFKGESETKKSFSEQGFERFLKLIINNLPPKIDINKKDLKGTLTEALHSSRKGFFIDELAYYDCHTDREGVIIYRKEEKDLPPLIQDILKYSKTKAGMLSVEKIIEKPSPLLASQSNSSSTISMLKKFPPLSRAPSPASSRSTLSESEEPSSSSSRGSNQEILSTPKSIGFSTISMSKNFPIPSRTPSPASSRSTLSESEEPSSPSSRGSTQEIPSTPVSSRSGSSEPRTPLARENYFISRSPSISIEKKPSKKKQKPMSSSYPSASPTTLMKNFLFTAHIVAAKGDTVFMQEVVDNYNRRSKSQSPERSSSCEPLPSSKAPESELSNYGMRRGSS